MRNSAYIFLRCVWHVSSLLTFLGCKVVLISRFLQFLWKETGNEKENLKTNSRKISMRICQSINLPQMHENQSMKNIKENHSWNNDEFYAELNTNNNRFPGKIFPFFFFSSFYCSHSVCFFLLAGNYCTVLRYGQGTMIICLMILTSMTKKGIFFSN